MSAPSKKKTSPRNSTAIIVGLVITLVSTSFVLDRDDDLFTVRKNFEIFGATYQELVANYVDELDAQRVMRIGLRAMLAEMDPYTTFFDEATNDQIRLSARGNVARAGLQLEKRDVELVVGEPPYPMSGYRQGVRPGDIVSSIDGQDASSLSLRQAYALLEGDEKSLVSFSVVRAGTAEPIEFLLIRETQQPKNVSYAGSLTDNPSIAVVKLNQFGRGAASEVKSAIEELDNNTKVSGLLLDLRGNPGGIVNEAVELCGLFLPAASTVVSTRSKSPEKNVTYKTPRQPVFLDLPVIVLVDSVSASASEIVAGALQDYDRAVIVGDQSYGKGLTQIIRPLPYNTSLKVTNDRFYLPSNRSIQSGEQAPGGATFTSVSGRVMTYGNGVSPDVQAEGVRQSEMTRQLHSKSLFFKYAQEIVGGNQQNPGSFSSSAAFGSHFHEWADGQGFTFTHPGKSGLQQFVNSIVDFDAAEQMEEIIEADVQKRIERSAASISDLVERQVNFLTMSQDAFHRWEYDVDEVSKKAAEIIADTRRYNDILTKK